jgi:hypothetical protein
MAELDDHKGLGQVDAADPGPDRRWFAVSLSETITTRGGTAIPSSSAISGPVKRRRRLARITRIRSSGVRLAIRLGLDERSSKPRSPSSRYLPAHSARSEG